jgi:N-acetylmuramoyl-L-alanine amidase
MERRLHDRSVIRASLLTVGVLAALWAATGGPTVEAHSNGHPRRRPVDAVIVHSLGGPDCRDGTRFFKQIDGDAPTWARRFAKLPLVSIHYVIDRLGAVAAGIPEVLAASHAIGWNQRSVGIELVNNGDGMDPFPQPQIDALRQLIQDIRRRHPDVAPERVLRHSDVDHTMFAERRHGRGCSAHRRKLDPGDAFPWDDFKRILGQDFSQESSTSVSRARAWLPRAAPQPRGSKGRPAPGRRLAYHAFGSRSQYSRPPVVLPSVVVGGVPRRSTFPLN